MVSCGTPSSGTAWYCRIAHWLCGACDDRHVNLEVARNTKKSWIQIAAKQFRTQINLASVMIATRRCGKVVDYVPDLGIEN